MATMDDILPRLHLLADTPTKRMGDPTTVETLALFVNRPSASATFFLPTGTLEADASSARARIDEYLVDVEANALTRCNATEEHRAVVRQLLLAYQAIYARCDDTPPDSYELLTGMLIEAALSLEDHEPADDILVEIVVWLHHVLPEDIFHSPLIPAETHAVQERNALPQYANVGIKQLVESNPCLSPHVHTPKEPSLEQPFTSPISSTPPS
ncbi:hypothetical protein L226DRAFT_520888 [Lentinus tigrinus ALCF2SS1-7]|uniref:uncharacterized protein n=1 Tax=Lentinus tigrinus ALCF2SS1-7 TaxID=1328758 RepID=UPI001165E370|nr:hypothetical protein L226DRAFT_520888 [Lentinus tigrinus ALCF2SS1-7]